MSFDWSAYVDLARQLSEGAQEAGLRSAISRSYYGVFCLSRNHLRDGEGQSVPTGADAHRYVRDQFRNSPDQARKELGENLNRLRIARNKADYNDIVAGLPGMSKTALLWAEDALARLAILK